MRECEYIPRPRDVEAEGRAGGEEGRARGGWGGHRLCGRSAICCCIAVCLPVYFLFDTEVRVPGAVQKTAGARTMVPGLPRFSLSLHCFFIPRSTRFAFCIYAGVLLVIKWFEYQWHSNFHFCLAADARKTSDRYIQYQ